MNQFLDHELNFMIIILGIWAVSWFLLLPFRLMNTGIPAWVCFGYAVVGLIIPFPGARLIPWAVAFFLPKGFMSNSF